MASPRDTEQRLNAALADGYRIEREIGRGGMATVYLAEDLKHDRAVAVKVLDPDLARTVGPERFLLEIKTAAGLRHPNILPVFDSGEADGFLFYVMPFVKGESLQDLLAKEKQLPIEDALQITREIADALAHAHGAGIIHRDVKPANIMLEAGHAVLADFGVARAVAEAGEKRLTQTGVSLGTPTYMSPEQTTGEHDLDGRSDQYSLGCVLYEMLTGEPPYTGPTPQAVFAKRLTEPVPRVSTLRETVPEGIEEAITRALAKAPADRFSTTAEFVAGLTSPGTLDFGLFRSARRRMSRRAVLTGLVGVVSVGTVAAVILGGMIGSTGGEPTDLSILAVLPCANRMGDPDQEYIAAGVHDEVLSGLGEIAGVEVRGRSSAMRFHDSEMSPREIANELGVGGLVECSVYQVGDDIGVRVSLLDAAGDRQVWSEGYQRAPGQVFLLGSDIAFGIVDALREELTPTETERVEAQLSESQEALVHFFRGRLLLNQWTEDGLRRSIEHFQDAVVLDSTFAQAYFVKRSPWGMWGNREEKRKRIGWGRLNSGTVPGGSRRSHCPLGRPGGPGL